VVIFFYPNSLHYLFFFFCLFFAFSVDPTGFLRHRSIFAYVPGFVFFFPGSDLVPSLPPFVPEAGPPAWWYGKGDPGVFSFHPFSKANSNPIPVQIRSLSCSPVLFFFGGPPVVFGGTCPLRRRTPGKSPPSLFFLLHSFLNV